MALPKTGVRLVAEGGPSFLRTLRGASDGVDKFERNTKSASAGTIAFGVAIGNLAAGALTTITGLLIDAGAAAVGFVGGSIQMAGELEAQMSGVAAVMGASNDELQLLNDLVVDLGIDPNLKVSSVEAAQAIEVLAKNGVELDDILNGVARGTVFLANAVGGDFALSADVATDAMNIFNFRADQMGEVVNGVAAVVQSSKFDINDFALALANGGATAANVGVSFQDFNTAIAAISPNFSSGQTAGTALKNMLLRLAPATDAAQAKMIALGIITGENNNAFFDSAGNMKSMAEIAGVLQTALGGLSDTQKTQALRTIFGNDAMGAAIGLAAVGADEFNELGEAMAQVDAGEAAATRVNNFAGAMDILDGTIEAVRLQIGDEFLPIVTDLARRLSKFVDQNADEFIAFFGNVAGFIEDATVFLNTFFLALDLGVSPMDAFRVALMNVVDIGGEGLFLTLADGVLTFLDAIRDGDSLVQAIFEGLIKLGLAKDTVLGIIDNFIRFRDLFTAVRDFVVNNKDIIIGAFLGIGAALVTAGIVGILTTIIGLIGTILSPIGLLIGAVALLGVAWSENWFGIRDVITDVWENKLKPSFIAIGEWLKINIPIAITTARIFFETQLIPALQGAWAFIRENVIPAFKNIWKWLQENIPAAIAEAKRAWDEDWSSAVVDMWNFANESLIPILTDIWDWLQIKIPIALAESKRAWNEDWQPAVIESHSFIVESLIPDLITLNEVLFVGVPAATTKAAKSWGGTLLAAMSSVWAFGTSEFLPFFKGVANFFDASLTKSVEINAGIWENILKPALIGVASVIITLVSTALRGLWSILKTILAPALITVKLLMDLFAKSTDEAGADIDGAVAKLSPLEVALGNIILFLQEATDWFNNMADAIRNMEIPEWLQRSSPSPIELSLMGTAEFGKMAAMSMDELARSLDRNTLLRLGGFGGLPTTGDQLGGGLLPRTSPISPPATVTQIRNATINNTINNSTVNFSGNFAGQPNITDRDMLIETLGTL